MREIQPAGVIKRMAGNPLIMKTTIHVTQEDIDEGQIGDCKFCPVALAMGRETESLWEVGHLRMLRASDQKVLSCPFSVITFIIAFDNKINVTPFSFRVDI